MEPRPKILPELTALDKFVEAICLSLLLLLWAFSIFAYVQLPEIIPIHFNASGKPDGYGSKMTLFLLPLISSALYLGLTSINRYPHIFNYTVKITEANAAQQYKLATRVLRFTKLAVVLIFSAIVFSTFQSGRGKSDGLGSWFFPMIIAFSVAGAVVPILLAARKS